MMHMQLYPSRCHLPKALTDTCDNHILVSEHMYEERVWCYFWSAQSNTSICYWARRIYITCICYLLCHIYIRVSGLHHWFKVMAWRRTGDKPLHASMMTYCQLDIGNKLQRNWIEMRAFLVKKCTRNLQNGRQWLLFRPQGPNCVCRTFKMSVMSVVKIPCHGVTHSLRAMESNQISLIYFTVLLSSQRHRIENAWPWWRHQVETFSA